MAYTGKCNSDANIDMYVCVAGTPVTSSDYTFKYSGHRTAVTVMYCTACWNKIVRQGNNKVDGTHHNQKDSSWQENILTESRLLLYV